jgi:hypothetical protein
MTPHEWLEKAEQGSTKLSSLRKGLAAGQSPLTDGLGGIVRLFMVADD